MLRKGDELIIMAADLVVLTTAILVVFTVIGWTNTAGGLTVLQLAAAVALSTSILLAGWALFIRNLHPSFMIPYIYVGGGIVFLISLYGYIIPAFGSTAPEWLSGASVYIVSAIFFLTYQPMRSTLFKRYQFDEDEYTWDEPYPRSTHHPQTPSGHAH